MLHLFNSCFVYPDFLINNENLTIIVGENYNKIILETEPLGRFETYDDFLNSSIFSFCVNSTEKIIIYSDNKQFLNFLFCFLATNFKQVPEWFLKQFKQIICSKVKHYSRNFNSTIIESKTEEFISYVLDNENILEAKSFDKEISFSGLHWKFLKQEYDCISIPINEYVYSYYEEARIKFLMRDSNKTSFLIKQKNYNIHTVTDFFKLYKEIRKQVSIFLDPYIYQHYYSKNSQETFFDKRVCLLLDSKRSKVKFFDPWLMRMFISMSPEKRNDLIGVLHND